MLKTLSLMISFLICGYAQAANPKFDLMAGYFSVNAKVGDNTVNVSNLSVLNIGYLKSFMDEYEFKLGYTIMSSDYSGADLGYGLNAGINYFPYSSSLEEKFKDQNVDISRYEDLKPFFSFGFYQRSFQSVRISYAGLGVGGGVEKFYNKQFNLKGEVRFIKLSGSSDSTATETNVLFGIVYKI